MKFLILKMAALALLYSQITSIAVAATPITITNIVSDSFNYPAGPLASNAGGTGWTSAWQNNGHNPLQITTPGALVYPGVSSAGGQIDWGGGGYQISDATRALPATNSGIVFVRFLMAQSFAQSGGGTPTLRFLSGGAETGAIGGNGGCPGGAVYSILNASLAATGCSTKSLVGMSLALVQIDYTQSITKMWVNPNLSSFDYLNPPAPDAQVNGLAPAMDQVALYLRGGTSFDELSIFRAAATPPAVAQPVPGLAWPSLLGLALGIALTVAALRRRQTRS